MLEKPHCVICGFCLKGADLFCWHISVWCVPPAFCCLRFGKLTWHLWVAVFSLFAVYSKPMTFYIICSFLMVNVWSNIDIFFCKVLFIHFWMNMPLLSHTDATSMGIGCKQKCLRHVPLSSHEALPQTWKLLMGPLGQLLHAVLIASHSAVCIHIVRV